MAEETEIRKYAKLMQELGLTALEVTENSQTLRLERAAAPQAVAAPLPAVPVQGAAAPAAEESQSVITSPMVGVFYAAPAENEDAFVKVGDSVKKGDTLCIVEAMKLMNEIQADKDGVITEICAADGDVVEYGTVLFKLKR